MSVQDSNALLYVFSGPHLGAVLEVGAGQWLLGSDDSCDLILRGLAPRHALLTLVQEEGTWRATLAPLDGAVRLQDGEEKNADPDGEEVLLPLPPAEAWYLGRTCFAWNREGAEQPDILPEAAARPRPAEELPLENEVDEAAATPESSVNKVADQQEEEGEEKEEVPPEVTLTPEEKRKGRVRRRFFSLALLVLLLGGMSLALTPEQPDPEQNQAIVRQYLEDAGLDGLQITGRDSGIEVRGAVNSDKDMLTLRDMARALQFPVYLEVGVREDMVRAVHSSLGIRGYHPAVSIVKRDGVSAVHIAAYMKDKLLENSAFAALSAEVKGLPLAGRRIMHESDVAPVLEAALKDAGLDSVRVLYLPGRVDFTGEIQPGDMPLLKRLRQEVSEQLGVPLFGASTPLLASREEHVSAAAPSAPPAALPEETMDSDPLGGLRITGVTVSPMRFVTTADGRRLFEGARLPGGCTLESISTKTLTLKRGDQLITYRLRGPQ